MVMLRDKLEMPRFMVEMLRDMAEMSGDGLTMQSDEPTLQSDGLTMPGDRVTLQGDRPEMGNSIRYSGDHACRHQARRDVSLGRIHLWRVASVGNRLAFPIHHG